MDYKKFIKLSKQVILQYFEEVIKLKFNKDNVEIILTEDDIYVVWLNRTLQNNKALLSTNVINGLYWEITYDGDRDSLYFDAYQKINNAEINNVSLLQLNDEEKVEKNENE